MKIQEFLGFGSINKKKGVSAYILTVNSYKGVLYFINILNGRMRTPKMFYLYNLIDWYPELNIKKLPIHLEPIESNSWLAGFVEADGHFSVRTAISGKYHRIECRVEIVQRQNDLLNNNNYDFLKPVADLLLTQVKEIRTDRKHPQYRVRTTSLLGNENVINYFNKFPLFGTKYLNYKDWVTVFELFKRKDYNYIEECTNIKNQMNDYRTLWNWDHLKNFYSLDK